MLKRLKQTKDWVTNKANKEMFLLIWTPIRRLSTNKLTLTNQSTIVSSVRNKNDNKKQLLLKLN